MLEHMKSINNKIFGDIIEKEFDLIRNSQFTTFVLHMFILDGFRVYMLYDKRFILYFRQYHATSELLL